MINFLIAIVIVAIGVINTIMKNKIGVPISDMIKGCLIMVLGKAEILFFLGWIIVFNLFYNNQLNNSLCF